MARGILTLAARKPFDPSALPSWSLYPASVGYDPKRQAGVGLLRWESWGAVAGSICSWRASPVLAILPTGAKSNRDETAILLGFNNDCAGRMALFAHAQRVAALSRCGELPRVRASAAAVVGFRAKASGRRVVRRVPRGARRARFLPCTPAFPPRSVRSHAPPGARRARRALETVRKVLTRGPLGRATRGPLGGPLGSEPGRASRVSSEGA
jgi:hypothetical protein